MAGNLKYIKHPQNKIVKFKMYFELSNFTCALKRKVVTKFVKSFGQTNFGKLSKNVLAIFQELFKQNEFYLNLLSLKKMHFKTSLCYLLHTDWNHYNFTIDDQTNNTDPIFTYPFWQYYICMYLSLEDGHTVTTLAVGVEKGYGIIVDPFNWWCIYKNDSQAHNRGGSVASYMIILVRKHLASAHTNFFFQSATPCKGEKFVRTRRTNYIDLQNNAINYRNRWKFSFSPILAITKFVHYRTLTETKFMK